MRINEVFQPFIFPMLYLTCQNFGFPTSIPRSTSSVRHRCSSTWSLLTVLWTPRPCSVLWKRRRPRRPSRRLQKCRSQWKRCGNWEGRGLEIWLEKDLGDGCVFFLRVVLFGIFELVCYIFSWFKIPIPFRFCFFLHLPPKNGGPNTSQQFFFVALKKNHQTRPPLRARCRCQRPWRSSWVKSPAPPRSVGRRGLGPRWRMPNHHQKRPSPAWRAVAAWEARRLKKRSTVKYQKIWLSPFCRELCGKMRCQAVILCCQVPHGVFLLIHWEQEEHSVQTLCFFVLASFYHSHPCTGVLYAPWPPDFDDRPPTPTPEDANQMDVARPLAPPVEIPRRPVEIPSEAQVGSVSFKTGTSGPVSKSFKEQNWSSTPRHSTVPMIISPFLAVPTEAHDNNCALLKLQAYFKIVAS